MQWRGRWAARWTVVSQSPESCNGSAVEAKGPSPTRKLSKYSDPKDYRKLRDNERPPNVRTERPGDSGAAEPGETSFTWVSSRQVFVFRNQTKPATLQDEHEGSEEWFPHPPPSWGPVQFPFHSDASTAKGSLLWVELCPPKFKCWIPNPLIRFLHPVSMWEGGFFTHYKQFSNTRWI